VSVCLAWWARVRAACCGGVRACVVTACRPQVGRGAG
jgi:hypothetical protein